MNSEPVDGYAECICGSAWFEIRPGRRSTREGEFDVKGAVSLDPNGMVTGVSGAFWCIECDKEWTPARERMKLVE